MTALRVPSFRRLWMAGLVSATGDWLLMVSLPILVYQYTGSTFGTAAAFLIELVPPVVLAPLTGRLADRLDRRRTLLLVSLAQAAALTPLLLVHDGGGLPILYAVIAVQAALHAIFEPTKSALLPTLVDRDRLVSANSLVGLNQNIGRLVGGPLGGLLLAVGGGLPTIVAVDAASFLLAFALIARLAPAPVAAATEHADTTPTGWGAILRLRPIRGGLVVLLTASAAQGIFVVLFVVFVAQALHGDAAEIGLLRGVQGIGAIAGGAPARSRRQAGPRSPHRVRGLRLRRAQPRHLERARRVHRCTAVRRALHRSRRTGRRVDDRPDQRATAGHRRGPARQGLRDRRRRRERRRGHRHARRRHPRRPARHRHRPQRAGRALSPRRSVRRRVAQRAG
jgi:hypothetical protein